MHGRLRYPDVAIRENVVSKVARGVRHRALLLGADIRVTDAICLVPQGDQFIEVGFTEIANREHCSRLVRQWAVAHAKPAITKQVGELGTTGSGCLTDDTLARGKLTVEFKRHVELVNSIYPPPGRFEREMQRPTFSPMEQNRLIEWRGNGKDPDHRPGGGIHYESRDDTGLFIVKVEAEEELTLPA